MPTRRFAHGLPLTLGVAAVAFGLDRWAKWWVVEVLDLPRHLVIDLAPPFVRLVMAWNTGVNFGIGSGAAQGVWIGLALAISAGLAVWSLRMTSVLRRTAVGLLIGGALGNALDRALYGAVADFLNVSCCGISNPYAFNPADIFIFAGALGLILIDPSDKPKAAPRRGDPSP